jgi:hypothetical protein
MTSLVLRDGRMAEDHVRDGERVAVSGFSGAPAEGVVRRELAPKRWLRLRGRTSGFDYRPDLGLLLPEERLETLPVGPLIEHRRLAAVV